MFRFFRVYSTVVNSLILHLMKILVAWPLYMCIFDIYLDLSILIEHCKAKRTKYIVFRRWLFVLCWCIAKCLFKVLKLCWACQLCVEKYIFIFCCSSIRSFGFEFINYEIFITIFFLSLNFIHRLPYMD